METFPTIDVCDELSSAWHPTGMWAVWYAEKGWPVIPCWWPLPDGACSCKEGASCGSPGKHPIGKLVPHGLEDASTDTAKIRSWWEQYPKANIALRTGIAFDVLDFDTPDAIDQLFTLGPCDFDGPGVATGKGFHVYVAVSGLGNRSPIPGAVDYRGKGGYVMAPPSLHYSGVRYTWGQGGSTGELPALPTWLQERLSAPRATETAERTEMGAPSPGAPAPAVFGLEDIDIVDTLGRFNPSGLFRKMREAVEGNRNATLNWCGYKLGQEYRARSADTSRPLLWSDAEEALIELRDIAVDRGLGAQEARQTLLSGFKSASGGGT